MTFRYCELIITVFSLVSNIEYQKSSSPAKRNLQNSGARALRVMRTQQSSYHSDKAKDTYKRKATGGARRLSQPKKKKQE
jgi:hypothetical protein